MMINSTLTKIKNIRLLNKRFLSNKNDYRIFNYNTNNYELNPNYENIYLSSFESFVFFPITFTKTFFATLFNNQ